MPFGIVAYALMLFSWTAFLETAVYYIIACMYLYVAVQATYLPPLKTDKKGSFFESDISSKKSLVFDQNFIRIFEVVNRCIFTNTKRWLPLTGVFVIQAHLSFRLQIFDLMSAESKSRIIRNKIIGRRCN